MKEFPTQQVLELACSAQRTNGEYIKENQSIYSDDGHFLYIKHTNKLNMLVTLNPNMWTEDPMAMPYPLKVSAEDTELAEDILKHFKRLLFAAIEGENEFLTKVNSLLSKDTVKENEFGWMACLPSVYVRDKVQNEVKRASRNVEQGFLGKPGDRLSDLDCQILEVVKSKNFTGWNICAIINNKMASWMSQEELQQGPCVITKAKVKDNSKHWKHGNDETRLNYVKAVQ